MNNQLIKSLLEAMHQDWCEAVDNGGTYGKNYDKLLDEIQQTLSPEELENLKQELINNLAAQKEQRTDVGQKSTVNLRQTVYIAFFIDENHKSAPLCWHSDKQQCSDIGIALAEQLKVQFDGVLEVSAEREAALSFPDNRRLNNSCS